MTRTAKLDAFVIAWRALRPIATSPTTGLWRFVEAWRQLAPLRALATAADGSAIRTTAADLAQVVAALKPALSQARASGASFNVWHMARLGRSELRNAGALAQLLDPRGNHGLGALPLRGLFDALLASAPSCPRPADLTRCTIEVEHRPLGSERDRIDLVVDHPDLLLFVEAKVDASEGHGQLARYTEASEQAARFVGRSTWRVAYLTRRSVPALPGDVIGLLWCDLAGAVRSRLAAATAPPEVRAPILHLLTHLASL